MPHPLVAILPWLDILGLSVFAVSGVLAAARRRLDIVGAGFFALVTATGGGTVRDLLIGAPVFWMTGPAPVLLCVVVTLAAWPVPLERWPSRALEWFDAIGLAAYAVYGAAKALAGGVHPVPAVAAGVVTACLGGVLRDVVAGVPSVMLRHELYVTAALVGASMFVGLTLAGVAAPWPAAGAFVAGVALRGAALRWRLTLPPHRGT